VIGWTWEVFITAVVNVIADAHTLELHQLVGVDFAIFVICLVVGLVLHYFLKDLQVEYPAEAIRTRVAMPTAVQDTENPLQVIITNK
jgi:Na+/glutamate symporter